MSRGGGYATSPSPDKGRAGEGLGFISYDKKLTALAQKKPQKPNHCRA